MSAFLRTACAFGLACLAGNVALAAEPLSVTAHSSPDDPIQLVSNEELTVDAGSGELCDGSDACDMSSLCCCDCPTWGVTAGAVILHRSRPDQAAIFTTIGGGDIISDGADFDFGWDLGPDFTISKRMANGLIWEVRYFNDREADATADYPGVNAARIFGVNVLGITSLTGNYTTKLDSTEINLRRPTTDVITFLAGFRWVEVHDQLTYDFNNGVLTTTHDENNHLYGGQIGMDLNLLNYDSPLRLNAAIKAGAYSNFADNNFTANAIFGTTSASDTDLAFVGDINVSASYQLTDHLAIRGGYQLLWIDRLALASDNAANAAAVGLGAAGIDTSGSLFYNGATVAAEFAW